MEEKIRKNGLIKRYNSHMKAKTCFDCVYAIKKKRYGWYCDSYKGPILNAKGVKYCPNFNLCPHYIREWKKKLDEI